GSSFGELVNELNFDYEVIKNPKVGIPLGKKSLGQKLPESVEAYYSGISKDLALLNVKAIEDIYSGRSKAGTEGKGLDDYLNQLNAQYNGGFLSAAINSQFDIVKSKIQVIPDPLSDAIINHQNIVEEAYSEIQKMVVLLKTDMPSAMGVLITYQDNDGD
ncbi:MAG: peptidase M75, Imelysin, partial [Bacteroidota bacterium]|nr:peptidase M75, Imelysin [Bacteroidota bacterium]